LTIPGYPVTSERFRHRRNILARRLARDRARANVACLVERPRDITLSGFVTSEKARQDCGKREGRARMPILRFRGGTPKRKDRRRGAGVIAEN